MGVLLWIVRLNRSLNEFVHLNVLNLFPSLYPYVDFLSLAATSIFRVGSGLYVAGNLEKCERPKNLLKLYEYEGCPFCKYVRECLNVLDIDYLVYPCPRETLKVYGYCKDSRFRPEVKEKGGSLMFPYLEDDNTGVKMYESAEIIKYLWKTYGNEAKSSVLQQLANVTPIRQVSLLLSCSFRPLMHMGNLRVESNKPEKPLELYGYELSPYTKRVREILCSLELQYIMHTLVKGSLKRQNFFVQHEEELAKIGRKSGRIMVPYLHDPNTGVGLFESADIVEYLKKTYQKGEAPNETWNDYGAGFTS